MVGFVEVAAAAERGVALELSDCFVDQVVGVATFLEILGEQIDFDVRIACVVPPVSQVAIAEPIRITQQLDDMLLCLAFWLADVGHVTCSFRASSTPWCCQAP